MTKWVARCFPGVKAGQPSHHRETNIGNNVGTNGRWTAISAKCNGSTTSDNFCWIIKGFCTVEATSEEEIINIDFLVSIKDPLMLRGNVSAVSKTLLQNRYKLLHELSLFQKC